VNYRKLSTIKAHRILRYFCDELTAVQTARICKLNRHTVDYHYRLYRDAVAAYQEAQRVKLRGNIEIDESYFGRRHRGDRRGRSTERKIPVVGLLKRGGQVYTAIIPDVSKRTLLPIIQGFNHQIKIEPLHRSMAQLRRFGAGGLQASSH